MVERIEQFVYQGLSSQRLDKFLVDKLPEFSRSRLQSLIKNGFVTVKELPAHKAGQILEDGMLVQVRIPPPEPVDLIPEAIPLDIIYENQDLLVIHKPAGMVVHPAAGHSNGTLVHAVLAHAPEIEGIGGERRPGIVHRLDKETSGLILVAKNERAHVWLQDQFRSRKVYKTYLCLVDGVPPTPSGRVDAAIGRHPQQRRRMAVMPEHMGRAAVSEYHVLETFHEHTLLEVHPVTGRTHQIRLHMAFLGCPVAGDTVYGRRKRSVPLKRHFLHAARLSIILPGQDDASTFEAPLPAELDAVLSQLRHAI